jgi:rhamnose utilization protein RhaD (predicted bifunctional aldolase and dehydrogenase)
MLRKARDVLLDDSMVSIDVSGMASVHINQIIREEVVKKAMSYKDMPETICRYLSALLRKSLDGRIHCAFDEQMIQEQHADALIEKKQLLQLVSKEVREKV